MDPVLEVRNITCGYKDRKVVDDISMEIDRGEVFCLLGPNGVGKTTFFKAMLGFMDIMDGSITLKGRDIRRMSYAEIARVVGYVPQSHTPPFPFTVREVVTMGRTSRISPFSSPSAHDRAVAEDAADSLGIGHLMDSVYTEISGGERQLALIARAIAQEPEVLVMDEPTSNLDFGNQIRVLKSINDLSAGGMGIIMTTHFPNHAFLSGDRVALMKGGRIIREGGPDTVITESNMKSVYGIDVRLTEIKGRGYSIKSCVPILPGNNGNGKEDKMRSVPLSKINFREIGKKHIEEAAEKSPAGMPQTRLVTDMAGRRLTVPADIRKVFGYNPMVTAVTYMLDPEKIAGLNMPPMPPERMFAGEEYLSMPVLGLVGGFFGGGKHTLNSDAVKQHKIDLMISMTLSKIDEVEVSQAEKMTAELNVPVLIFDGSLDRSGDVLRRIGRIIGAEKRGDELGDYCDRIFERVRTKLAKIPMEDRKRVYYAQSPTGLQTEPRGARHGEVIDFAGGVNVAEVFEQRGCGRTQVGGDELLRWNPEYIIVMSDEGKSDDRLINRMKNDPFWSGIKAVKKGHVYEPPGAMYGWFDRPPSANRIMGLIWLTDILYPDVFKWDMTAEVISFYSMFYRMRLSEKQAEGILRSGMMK